MLIVKEDYRLGGIPRPYVTNYHNAIDLNMQIPNEIRKCVVFLAHINERGEKILKGTGFFISIPFPDKSGDFIYLITARHIIAKIIAKNLALDGNIWMRINKRDGSFDFIPIPINTFIPHPDSVDVMILPFAPSIAIYDYLTLPHGMLLNQDIVNEENVSLGDDVFMTGLFVRHIGKERNIPIIRIGNISAMPEEPIYNEFFGNMDAYLIELRSLGGLSGSPVFLHLSDSRIMKSDDKNTIVRTMSGGHKFYLLGLLHGHWDLESATQDVITEDYPQDNKEQINTGIGIAIPAIKILETLNQDIVQRQRQSIIIEHLKKTSPTEDINKLPSDFERLIDKAIERSPKDD